MEPQGGRGISPFRVTKRSTKLRRLSKTTRPSRVHVQTVGLNAETKKVSAPSRRREISLDIPFYRTFWRGTGMIVLLFRGPNPSSKTMVDCFCPCFFGFGIGVMNSADR